MFKKSKNYAFLLIYIGLKMFSKAKKFIFFHNVSRETLQKKVKTVNKLIFKIQYSKYTSYYLKNCEKKH